MKLKYAYDPLCGWCFGFIPALKHFAIHEPDVSVDVVPGGLFVGDPPRPYQSLIKHIRSAEVQLHHVTGRKPSEAFHRMISRNERIDAASERPGHAILQLKALAPDRVLEFSHRLQEVHYEDGKDLNSPETYRAVCAELDLPDLDLDAVVSATLADPLIRNAYEACAALRPSGYPSIFLCDDDGTPVEMAPNVYDPDRFLTTIRSLRDRHFPSHVQPSLGR